jgi:hypothetical protein
VGLLLMLGVFSNFQSEDKYMKNATKTNAANSKFPNYIAYQVQSREGKKSFWRRIGGAWMHADGNGFNVQLEVLPIDGRITLRVPSKKER